MEKDPSPNPSVQAQLRTGIMGNGQKLGSSDSRSVSLSSPAVGLWLLSLGRSLGTGAVCPFLEFGFIWLGCKWEFFSGKVYAFCCPLVASCFIDGQISEPSQLWGWARINDDNNKVDDGGELSYPWPQGLLSHRWALSLPLVPKSIPQTITFDPESLGAAQSESIWIHSVSSGEKMILKWGEARRSPWDSKEEQELSLDLILQERYSENSLISQWLALGGFAAVGLGSMVGKRTKILLNHAAQLKKKKKKKKRETLRDLVCNPSALQTRRKRIRIFFIYLFLTTSPFILFGNLTPE